MFTLEALATFFGWCTVLNVAFYVLSLIALTAIRGFATRMMMSIFNIDEAQFSKATFEYIARWKLLIIAFNFVPYLALKIMLAA